MEFAAYGLDVKKLPEPFAEFIIWSADRATSAEQLQICLEQQVQKNSYLCGPWQELELAIRVQEAGKTVELALLSGQCPPGPAVVGRVITGETTTAEWALTEALMHTTAALPGVIAQLVDGDGNFLAIEAADHLPLWCTPETSENRVFLLQGEVHFLPPLPRDSTPPAAPSLQQASERLLNAAECTRADDAVQTAISDRIFATTRDPAWAWTQRLTVQVPSTAAHLLQALPWAATAAVEALAAELVTPASLNSSVLLPRRAPPATPSTVKAASVQLCSCSVVVSRVAAAKLANASVLPSKTMQDELYERLVHALASTGKDAVPDTATPAWQLRFGVALTRGLDALLLHSPPGAAADDTDALGPLCMRGSLLQHQSALQATLEAATQSDNITLQSEYQAADSMQWLLALQAASSGSAAAAGGDIGESLPQFLQFLSSDHDVRGVGAASSSTEAASPGPHVQGGAGGGQLGGRMAAHAKDDAESDSEEESDSDHEQNSHTEAHAGGRSVVQEGGHGTGGGQLDAGAPDSGFAQMAKSWKRAQANLDDGQWMDSGSDDDGSDGGEGGEGGERGWHEDAIAAAGEIMDQELGGTSMRHSFLSQEQRDAAASHDDSDGGRKSSADASCAVPIPSEAVMAENYIASLTESMQSGHGAGPAAVTLSHLD